jgi:proline dehydrogenase
MLDFSNTQIAFAHKNKSSLKKAYWLFKTMGNPTLVNTGSALANWALKMKLPIKGIIRNTLYQQFVGGEDIKRCEQSIQALAENSVGTILDYSVEGMEGEDVFDAGAEEIVRTIHKANGDLRIPFAVFKVTGVARFGLLEKVSYGKPLSKEEEKEWNEVVHRVNWICEEGFKVNQPVMIDAEETWIQPAIDQLAFEMMKKYNKNQPLVYNTVQLYRHDRINYLKELFVQCEKESLFLGVKLVRGAYMEKERERAQNMGYPSPIQPNKAATDRDFDLAVEFCVEHIAKIGLVAGSHNEESNYHLARLLDAKGLPKNHPHVYFSQLLGMSDHISFNLSNAGYNVAKYVPYGPVEAVFPYLIRRARENTSVAGQVGRELGLILKEHARRKK